MTELAALNPPEGWVAPSSPPRPAVTHQRHAPKEQRRDIQGLRAVAVIAVVVNHLFNHPRGGFVGVDVFFVVSGFLITSLLLREEARGGSISLLGFYRRRVRRLVPASLLVIGATVLAAHFAFISERAHSVQTDGIWTALFAGNWHFLQIGTNYFQSYGPVSPLQHYWSLSVEEQFYAVWPLMLIVVMFVARRVFHGRRHAVLATGVTGALTLTLPSLIYAATESSHNPTAAYFSTFTRAWELGLGAIIAVVIPYMRGSRVVLSALSWVGVAMIGASFALVSSQHFPFPGALLPTVGTALVLLAHTSRERAYNALLTNRVSVYIGDISYSVYLVHFPLIVILGSLTVQHPWVSHTVVLVATLGASMLLFHLVEDPIRNSAWLEPKRVKASREPHEGPPNWRNLAVLGAGGVTLALTMWVLGGVSESPANPYLTAGVTITQAPTAAAQQHLTPNVAAVQADLRLAIQARTWPKISPDFSHPIDKDDHGCAVDSFNPIAQCTWGSATAAHTLYMVGDSTSAAYLSAFTAFIDEIPNWKLVVRSDAGCPFSTTPVAEDGGAEATAATEACTAHNEHVVSEIKTLHPDLVVFTTVTGGTTRLVGKRAELERIKSSAGKIVVLPAPPQVQNPLECVTAVSQPSDCVSPIPSNYNAWAYNLKGVASGIGGTYLDTTLLYCADNLCPIFVKTIPKTKDGVHMTVNYAQYIAPALKELFETNKLLP